MSGQFPGGYSSPMGGHRGNFGNQMVNMNMMQNQMNMMGYNQGNMMAQSQQSQMQNAGMNMNQQGVSHGGGDLQNPQHSQQQSAQQTLQQQQMQQLQQQQMQQQQQQMQQQQQAPQLTLQTASTPTPTSGMLSQQNIQQQQPQTGMLTSAPQLPQKEINTVSLTKLGQETVQEITSRFQEIFSALKTIQPTGNRENSTEKRVQEYFRTIRLLFKRLRIIYEKSNDGCSQGMEYTHVESLIPYKDEPEQTRSESTQCEEYKKALQENRELIETVMLKNKQLREIIDRIRIIIWEINTMLSMRRS